jgi:hypothetical protein
MCFIYMHEAWTLKTVEIILIKGEQYDGGDEPNQGTL